MNKKIKVLCYMDSPSCATGFGTVARNITEGLYRTGRYDIDILGINYWGDPHNFPYRIWPVGTNSERDPYGRKKVCNMIPQMEYDLLFFLQDTFILDFLPELIQYLKSKGRQFKSICYYPIDGVPKEAWIRNISYCDTIVTYSLFGREESYKAYPELKEGVLTIPHGVNTTDYSILSDKDVKDFRKRYFGINANKFIFTNLNRNQQRKDIPRTIQAFKEFKKVVPESMLYLHMAMNDQGWNLPEVCRAFDLATTSDVVFPENFGPNQGYPRPIVNMLYNCSDCVISTTLGEGWGLSWSEAMATKTPVIMPRNTALAEAISDEYGYLVNSGTNPSLFTVLPHDNEVIRPLVDVEDMVKTMLHVYNNYDEAKKKAEKAYVYAKMKLDWQGPIAKEWIKVFDDAYTALNTKEESRIEEALTGEKVIESEVF